MNCPHPTPHHNAQVIRHAGCRVTSHQGEWRQKPYKFKIFSGVGSIDANGIFSSAVPGLSTIQIEDSSGLTAIITATTRVIAKDPAALTGISGNVLLWLKADALALADGNAVTNWPRSMGNSIFSCCTASNAPTYKTGLYNGQPAVRFNGSLNAIPVNPNAFGNDMTFFLVATPSSTANAYILAGNDGNGGPGIVSNWVSRAYEYFHIVSGVVDRSILQTTTSGLNLLTVSQTGTTNLRLYFNSLLQLDTNPVNTINGSAITTMGIYGGGNAYAGDIAEFIVYNSALSPIDRSAIECYLIKKYNLPAPDICQ